MERLFCCALLLAASGASAADGPARVSFDPVPPELIQQRLERVALKNSERRTTLESMFQEVGCEGTRLTEQPFRGSKDPNVICTLPGDLPGIIVVGGHFDFAELGIGAVDDWSGASLLPSLYQSFRAKPHRHTLVFIGFAGEEKGLLGSSAYVKQLSKEERGAVRAMINLECLGLNPPEVWGHRADKRLLDAYMRVANALGLPLVSTNVDRVGDDDSHAFLRAKIPVITFHSITQETLPLLHSTRDDLKAIHPDQYYNAYRLAALYLGYLDTTLE
jgi:hypothetical protein